MKTILLILLAHSAATLDAYTTRYGIEHYNMKEVNPVAKPFSYSNSLYLTVQLPQLGADILLLKLNDSTKHQRLRSVAKLFTVINITSHGALAGWNATLISNHRKVR